jgi:putative ABC transport system permease protein
MNWLRGWLLRLGGMFRKQQCEREFVAEIDGHLQLHIEDNLRAGMSHEEARRQALIKLGGIEQTKEMYRDRRSLPVFETFLQDLRYGLRMLSKNPGFTCVAILTLALGIGANTAVFSVVYAVLLQPLPYKDPSRLVVLNETTPMVGTVSVSYPNFLDWRAGSHSFSQMAVMHAVAFNLAGVSQPENITGDAVSPNFLSMMGIRPFLGRDFAASEEKAGTLPVVLLSYSLWQSHLGSDLNAVGKTIALDGRSFTIVGVLPSGYRSLDKTDVLLPIGVWATDNSEEAAERGERGNITVIARLAPGSTFAQARAEMEAIAARLAKEFPGTNDQFGVALRPIRDAFTGDARPAILVLFGAVLFVLLIACANVANLFLVRGSARTREIALRMAFGAGRSRIIRQMLTESFVLAFFGGVLGLAFANAGVHGITRLIPADTLMGSAPSLNGTVLLFVAGVVLLAAFLFGLAPAAHSANPDVQSELKEGARTVSAGAAHNRLRGALAVAELSLALILLVGAGLMMKSLFRLMNVDPGFRADQVLKLGMELRTQQYSKGPAILNFWQQVLDRVGALPEVESAAVGTVVPLADNHSRADITVEGMALPAPGYFPHPDVHIISPDYPATLGIPLLRGRTFTAADNLNAPRVALINAMLAKRFFPNGDPIGKRFIFGRPPAKQPPQWYTIVGVLADTKLYGLANPARLEVYDSYLQDPTNGMDLLVKSRADPAALTSSIRAAVQSIDKDQPLFAISTMKELVSNSLATRRITLVLLGLFSGLALILGAIGIYGVISYSVAQRTHEIGIRAALGAQRRDVLRLVMSAGAKIVLFGIVFGIVGALALTRMMASLLFEVQPADLATFAAVTLLLALVAFAASYIPARRAMRVDPMVALRFE